MTANAETLVTESVGSTACQPRCKDGFFLVDGVTSEIYDKETRITSTVPNTFLCDYETYYSEEFKWFVEPSCRVVKTCNPVNDCFGGTCSVDKYSLYEDGNRKYWCYLKGVAPFQSTVGEDIEKDTLKCRDCFSLEYPTGDNHYWVKSYDIGTTQIEGMLAAQEAAATCNALTDCATGCEQLEGSEDYCCRLKNVLEDGDGFKRGDIAKTKCSDVQQTGVEERTCKEKATLGTKGKNVKLYWYSDIGDGIWSDSRYSTREGCKVTADGASDGVAS